MHHLIGDVDPKLSTKEAIESDVRAAHDGIEEAKETADYFELGLEETINGLVEAVNRYEGNKPSELISTVKMHLGRITDSANELNSCRNSITHCEKYLTELSVIKENFEPQSSSDPQKAADAFGKAREAFHEAVLNNDSPSSLTVANTYTFVDDLKGDLDKLNTGSRNFVRQQNLPGNNVRLSQGKVDGMVLEGIVDSVQVRLNSFSEAQRNGTTLQPSRGTQASQLLQSSAANTVSNHTTSAHTTNHGVSNQS